MVTWFWHFEKYKSYTILLLLQQLSNYKSYNFIIFLVKNIGRPPYRHHYTCDWLLKIENLNVTRKTMMKIIILKFLMKIIISYIRKVSMHLILNFSFDDDIFFFFFILTLQWHLLSPHFLFYMHDKHSAIVSKVHVHSFLRTHS
jgi:hypothetical protein